jgi:hypothetical protein
VKIHIGIAKAPLHVVRGLTGNRLGAGAGAGDDQDRKTQRKMKPCHSHRKKHLWLAIGSRDLAALRRKKELISSVPKETGGINNLA